MSPFQSLLRTYAKRIAWVEQGWSDNIQYHPRRSPDSVLAYLYTRTYPAPSPLLAMVSKEWRGDELYKYYYRQERIAARLAKHPV